KTLSYRTFYAHALEANDRAALSIRSRILRTSSDAEKGAIRPLPGVKSLRSEFNYARAAHSAQMRHRAWNSSVCEITRYCRALGHRGARGRAFFRSSLSYRR